MTDESEKRIQQLEAVDGVERVTTFNETTLRVVLEPLADSEVCRKVNAIMGHAGSIGWDDIRSEWDRKIGVVVDYPWEWKDD